MQKTDALTLQFGAATVTVPADAAARAYLEKFMTKSFAETLTAQPHGATPPEIGEPWKGGTYAGVSLVGNQPVHLILLHARPPAKKWQEANDWAASDNATLPSRIDALVLFQNLPDEFEKEWYWTADEYARHGDYAWAQYFYSGYQYYWRKGSELRAVAVRRFIID